MNRIIVTLLMCLMILPGIAQAELTNSPFDWEIDLTTPIADNPIMGSLVYENETYLYEKDGKDINYYSTEDGSTLIPGSERCFEMEQDSYFLLAQDQEDYLLMNVESKYTGLQEPTAWDYQAALTPIVEEIYTDWVLSDSGNLGYINPTWPYEGFGGTGLYSIGDPIPYEIMGHETPDTYPVYTGPTPEDRYFNMEFKIRDLEPPAGSSGSGLVQMGLYDYPTISRVLGADLSLGTGGIINRAYIIFNYPGATRWVRSDIVSAGITWEEGLDVQITVDMDLITITILDNNGVQIPGLDYTTNPTYGPSSTIYNYGKWSMEIPTGSGAEGDRNHIGVGLPHTGSVPVGQFYCKGMGITTTPPTEPRSEWDYYATFGGETPYTQVGDEIYLSNTESAIICDESIPYAPGYISSFTYAMPVSYRVDKDLGNDPVHMRFKIEDIDLATSGVIRGGLNNPLDPTSFAGFTLRNNAFEGALEIKPSYNYDIYESWGSDIQVPYEDVYIPAGIDVSSITIDILFDDDDIYLFVFDENGERLFFQMYNPVTPDTDYWSNLYGITAMDMTYGNGNGYWGNIGVGSLWDGHSVLNCKITSISIDSQEYPFTTDTLTMRKTNRPLDYGWFVGVTNWPPAGYEDMYIIQPTYLDIDGYPMEIVKEDETYYLYARDMSGPEVKVYSSPDLTSWTYERDMDNIGLFTSMSIIQILDDYFLMATVYDGLQTHLTAYRDTSPLFDNAVEHGVIWSIEAVIPTLYIHRDNVALSSFDGSSGHLWAYISDTTDHTYLMSYVDIDYSMGFNPYREAMELDVVGFLVFIIVLAVIVGIVVAVRKSVG